MATNKLVKPSIFLFFSHLTLFILSIIIFLDFLNINLSMQICLIIHALGFIVLLIFLTIDKSLSSGRNYSSDFTVTTSKVLLYAYILFGAYLSWEIGYDFAYEQFLTSF
ncbi:hypothetical protein N8812_02645 [Acidimicrobiia bacterium]|nr:hypothetical protein [Acidimicrobiia bacterium]